MNCPSCNSELHSGQKFCIQCGTNVAHLTAATTAMPAGYFPPPVVGPTGAPYTQSPSPLPSSGFNIVEQTVPVPTAPDHWAGPAWQVGDTSPFAAASVPGTTAGPYDTTQFQPTTFQPVQTGQVGWVGAGTGTGGELIVTTPAQGGTSGAVLAGLAGLAGAAAIVGSFLPMLTLTTDAPVAPELLGDYKLNDFAFPALGGTNLLVAFVVAGLAMLVGGVLAKVGKRFGAGLAGGAALALIPFVVCVWGLTSAVSDGVEAQATRIAKDGLGGSFYEGKPGIGLYVLIGAAVVGLIGLLVSFAQSGPDGLPPLNRAVCAGGALAAVVAGVGQLIPTNDASFSLNYETEGTTAAFVYGRLAIIFVVAIAGVAGFLLSNRWGIGLAIGGASMYIWQWISSLTEAGDFPVAPAFYNPGATDLKPHLVTTAGVIAMLVLAGLAFIAARPDVEVT